MTNSTSLKEAARAGAVLLFSGGLDSQLVRLVWGFERLVYVDAGTRYTKAELERLPSGVEVVDMRGLGAFERDDAILPMRNAFLALAGLQFSDTVAFGFTAGDCSRDKDRRFAADVETLACHMAGSWNQGRRARVLLPAKGLTKSELVRLALLDGVPRRRLALDTFSCYRPAEGGEPCGRCKACFRRWVALERNGVDSEPCCRDYGLELVAAASPEIFGRGAETREALFALGVASPSWFERALDAAWRVFAGE